MAKSKKPQSLSQGLTPFPRPYGTVTVGSKGQIVIPKEVREKMDISEGDQLFVMLKDNKAIGLIKANDLQEMLQMMQQEIDIIRKMK